MKLSIAVYSQLCRRNSTRAVAQLRWRHRDVVRMQDIRLCCGVALIIGGAIADQPSSATPHAGGHSDFEAYWPLTP